MEKGNKKWGLVIWNGMQILVIIYVILITGFILCKNSFGYTQMGKFVFVTINDDNYKYMEDSQLGELLVIKEDTKVKKGDLIYYYSVVDDHYVIKSGFVQGISDKGGSNKFILDEERNIEIVANRLIGSTVNSYSGLGKIFDILTSSVGFLLFVLLPVILIFVYKIYELIMIVNAERKVSTFDDVIIDDVEKRIIDDVVEAIDDIEII